MCDGKLCSEFLRQLLRQENQYFLLILTSLRLVAQLAEQLTLNQRVQGSSPCKPTIFCFGIGLAVVSPIQGSRYVFILPIFLVPSILYLLYWLLKGKCQSKNFRKLTFNEKQPPVMAGFQQEVREENFSSQ